MPPFHGGYFFITMIVYIKNGFFPPSLDFPTAGPLLCLMTNNEVEPFEANHL